jgi:transcription-repair coupling factor (superfamily II helicase)
VTKQLEPGDIARQLDEQRALSRMRYPLAELRSALLESGRVALTGASGSWLGALIAELASSIARPVVVVTPHANDGRYLADAVATFLPPGASSTYLPTPDVSPYAGASPDRLQLLERLRAGRALRSLKAGDVCVASATAWARRQMPLAVTDQYTVTLALNDEVDLVRLRKNLLASGYTSVSLVEDPGTFSMRGDLVDIFSPDNELPVRIELYGDMIEQIRVYDPRTQRSGDPLEHTRIVPAREEILDDAGHRVRAREVAAAGRDGADSVNTNPGDSSRPAGRDSLLRHRVPAARICRGARGHLGARRPRRGVDRREPGRRDRGAQRIPRSAARRICARA